MITQKQDNLFILPSPNTGLEGKACSLCTTALKEKERERENEQVASAFQFKGKKDDQWS